MMKSETISEVEIMSIKKKYLKKDLVNFPDSLERGKPSILTVIDGINVFRAFAFVLSFEHKVEPDRLEYLIPLKKIFNGVDSPQRSWSRAKLMNYTEDIKEKLELLGETGIHLNRDDIKRVFGPKSNLENARLSLFQLVGTQFDNNGEVMINLRLTPVFKEYLIYNHLTVGQVHFEVFKRISSVRSAAFILHLSLKQAEFGSEGLYLMKKEELFKVFTPNASEESSWAVLKRSLERVRESISGTDYEFNFRPLNVYGAVLNKSVKMSQLHYLELRFKPNQYLNEIYSGIEEVDQQQFVIVISFHF